MLRYLRRLSDRDYALDRGMIPLGSCTMKLNATTEMEPITWPEFADLHPFAPAEQTPGLPRADRASCERWLAEVTGYDAVSLQPNAGSQGELAGLLAIRGYHRAQRRRRARRLPDPVVSAHGTNAASAVMAGMRVVVVACDEDGQRRPRRPAREDRRSTADRLAAIMVTYPSTHGVYEDGITELCAMVHDAGGQVYVDGANLNALLGYAQPGQFGGDVSHLNLHKTFCIPHGGGGPGCRAGRGPRAPRAVPAEPPAARTPGSARARPGVSARRTARPGILPISWAYMRLMGADGLTAGDRRRRCWRRTTSPPGCGEHYPVLYTRRRRAWSPTSASWTCAAITKATGVTVDDVAKRLIDYGFHAPTMSFPVAGTLMVEPTESRGPGRARPVLRRDDRDPRGDRPGRGRGVAGRTTTRCATRRTRPRWSPPTSGRTPTRGRSRPTRPASYRRRSTGHRCAASTQLRRPQPGLLVPAGVSLRGVTDYGG